MSPKKIGRIYTGDDGRSHFEDLIVPMNELNAGERISLRSALVPATSTSGAGQQRHDERLFATRISHAPSPLRLLVPFCREANPLAEQGEGWDGDDALHSNVAMLQDLTIFAL